MIISKGIRAAAAAVPLLAASSGWAQDAPEAIARPADPSVETGGDSLTVGIGAAYGPSFEGSDDYRVRPGGALRGSLGGVNFWMRGTGVFVDVIPDRDGGLDFSAGPVAGVRLSRTSGIKDAQVKALGELDTAWELGGFVGIAKTGVITSAYDNLGVRLSYVKDVGGAHQSHIITPAIEYGTPLSRTSFVGLSLSADFVGDGYASYYFDVTPAGSAASGLSPFSAKGGFKSWSLSSLASLSLSGDIRKGWALFALGSYSRLQNDFRRSSIVSEAGSPDQWFGALGIGYTF